MLRLPQSKVRCIHMEGSGCYGHNGADDAAADAALIARALPGRPVRVQWMREHEHAWEPYGPAMVTSVRAALDSDGTHRRLGVRGLEQRALDAARAAPATCCRPGTLQTPLPQPAPEPIPQPTGGGDRNAIPLYGFRTRASCTTSSPTCRCGSRRCARSAPT